MQVIQLYIAAIKAFFDRKEVAAYCVALFLVAFFSMGVVERFGVTPEQAQAIYAAALATFGGAWVEGKFRPDNYSNAWRTWFKSRKNLTLALVVALVLVNATLVHFGRSPLPGDLADKFGELAPWLILFMGGLDAYRHSAVAASLQTTGPVG